MVEEKNVVIPYVTDANNTRTSDLFSRMLEDRIIFLMGPVTPEMANTVIAQLLYLEGKDGDKDIYMYINSPGGSVADGLAIYDTMKYISCDVCTICMGKAMSMGALLLAAGTKGKRFSLEHSEIMIHQVLISGGLEGQATDVAIYTKQLLKTKEKLNKILSECTGQSYDKVCADTERDNYMSAQDAKAYGLIDDILVKRKK
ncbi:MAG: ATP-dependent Clp protease proteolytic subunit [Clostridia bacterium]|nr:ATP-dependent Clp protease proteolytic subunit [Clostridia bacterium]